MPENSEKGEQQQQPVRVKPPHTPTANISAVEQNDDHDRLPRYSEPASAPSSSAPPAVAATPTPGLPPIDLSQYLASGATLSKDEITVTVSQNLLCSDPAALVRFLAAQTALPPRPLVRITGTNDYGERKIDFDLRLDLMRYLVALPGQAPANYVKIVEANELAYRGDSVKSLTPHVNGGLREWASLFCRSSATNKAFILERAVTNWNTNLLEGRIRTLLASLRYQGKIDISFPVTHAQVVVVPPAESAGLLPRLLSFVTERRRFAVVRTVWPYANMEDRAGAGRICTVQSEDEWWHAWNRAIAAAVLEKRRGWVTIEDLIDATMCGKTEVKVPSKNWGSRPR